MLAPEDPRAPKYWVHETGGFLRPAIERYLTGKPAEPEDITWIRLYLRQWIDSPVWDIGAVEEESRRKLADLRRQVRTIKSRADISAWLGLAEDLGIDPL